MTDIAQIGMLVMLSAGFFAGIVFGISYNYSRIRKAGKITTKKGDYTFTARQQ